MGAKALAKKSEVISGLAETRRAILDTASALAPGQQDEVFLGIWSVKDLLAHLAGWDFANLEAAQAVLRGDLPEFYAHHDRDWQTYNARLVAQHKKADWADMVAAVQESHRELVEHVRTIPAEELDREKGVRFKGYKVTIARLLQAETGDEKRHAAQIREFWGLAGRLEVT